MTDCEIAVLFDKANAAAFESGDISLGLELFQQLKEKLLSLGGGEPPSPYTDDLISALLNIGFVYRACNKVHEAKPFFFDAELLFNKLDSSTEISVPSIKNGIYLNSSLANIEIADGCFDKAEKYLQQCEILYARFHNNNDDSYALQFLQTKGFFYIKQNRYEEAYACLDQAEKNALQQIKNVIDLQSLKFAFIQCIDLATLLNKVCLELNENERAFEAIVHAYDVADRLCLYESNYSIEEFDSNYHINYLNLSKVMLAYEQMAIFCYREGAKRDAIEAYEMIERKLNKLHRIDYINNNERINILIIPHIIRIKICKALVLRKLDRIREVSINLDEALHLLDGDFFYPTNFTQLLQLSAQAYAELFKIDVKPIYKPIEKIISSIYRNSIPVDASAKFHKSANLLLRWYELQGATIPEEDTKNILSFWREWMLFALSGNNGHLLVDILLTSHARRQLSILNGYWLMHSGSLDREVSQFVALRKKMHEAEVKLLQMEAAKNNDASAIRPQYAYLLSEYHALQKEWLARRSALIEQKRYPDFSAADKLDATKLQGYLQDDEAVMLSVAMGEFGLHSKKPSLLLVRKDRIIYVESPEIAAATEAMRIIDAIQTMQGRHMPLRYGGRNTESDRNNHADVSLPQLFERVQLSMMRCWRKLSSKLDGIRQLSIIGHGSLYVLPWQYYCPIQDNRFYAGIHAYVQRKKSAGRVLTLPSAARPVYLLTHDAADNPTQRLYYIAAEIDFIQEVWGTSKVRIINDLNEFSYAGYLFLLGHGDFDAKTGCARFMLKERCLEVRELLDIRQEILTLGASACLLAQTRDISNEPLGLFSLCGNRPDIQFFCGSILPVDDLGAALISLHFHYYWRELGSPQEAMRLALTTLKTGHWPKAVQDIFRTVMAKQAPALFIALRDDKDAANTDENVIARINGVLKPWGYYRDDECCEAIEVLENDLSDEQAKQVATNLLVEELLQGLLVKPETILGNDFLPFWLFG